jgi:hypothetical protein
MRELARFVGAQTTQRGNRVRRQGRLVAPLVVTGAAAYHGSAKGAQ